MERRICPSMDIGCRSREANKLTMIIHARIAVQTQSHQGEWNMPQCG